MAYSTWILFSLLLIVTCFPWMSLPYKAIVITDKVHVHRRSVNPTLLDLWWLNRKRWKNNCQSNTKYYKQVTLTQYICSHVACFVQAALILQCSQVYDIKVEKPYPHMVCVRNHDCITDRKARVLEELAACFKYLWIHTLYAVTHTKQENHTKNQRRKKLPFKMYYNLQNRLLNVLRKVALMNTYQSCIKKISPYGMCGRK